MPERSWSLNDTLALGGSFIVNTAGFIAVNDTADLVFFFDDTGQQVWSWADDGTLTDISSTTFNGADDQILDIAWSNGSLYVAYIYNASDEGKIARWDGVGMTSWTDVWTIDEGGTPGVFSTAIANRQFLDADDDRITVAGFATTGNSRIASSTNGTSWTIETVESSATYDYIAITYGQSHGGVVDKTYVLTHTDGDVNRVVANDAADNWEQVNSDAVSSAIIVFNAVAAGLSFWFTSAPYRIIYSEDFGETFASAGISSDVGGVYRTLIKTLTNGTAGIVMACDRTDEQAYTWRAAEKQFVTDGQTGDDPIVNFFVLDGGLYALCNDSAVTGQCLVYEADFALNYGFQHSSAGMPGSVI